MKHKQSSGTRPVHQTVAGKLEFKTVGQAIAIGFTEQRLSPHAGSATFWGWRRGADWIGTLTRALPHAWPLSAQTVGVVGAIEVALRGRGAIAPAHLKASLRQPGVERNRSARHRGGRVGISKSMHWPPLRARGGGTTGGQALARCARLSFSSAGHQSAPGGRMRRCPRKPVVDRQGTCESHRNNPPSPTASD